MVWRRGGKGHAAFVYGGDSVHKELEMFDVNELNEIIGIHSKTTGHESTR